MRIAALVAVSLLVAGCSHAGGGQSGQPASSQPPANASPTTTGPSTGKSPVPSAAPGASAPISDVIAWIEAGHPADPGRYHAATRDGDTTQLGNDIAMTANAGRVSCMTDAKHLGGALACLVQLSSPPPRPETAYGDWQGGWTDFDGTKLQVGASRGDPGPFVNGNGPELADGDSLAFGDYRCRADPTGLFCVNYAHQSAVRFASAGIQPFGCLRAVPPPDGIGLAFSC
jgi:hypothetical protein